MLDRQLNIQNNTLLFLELIFYVQPYRFEQKSLVYLILILSKPRKSKKKLYLGPDLKIFNYFLIIDKIAIIIELYLDSIFWFKFNNKE